ncbi:MAG: hypothetical protein OEM39_02100 [Acidimicrobiia bacterium]|nr:hypothetical protein [Acidimicrobiia bacterium]MDH3463986.1 hypothetical protein [Acidimicrobiia bacterium]
MRAIRVEIPRSLYLWAVGFSLLMVGAFITHDVTEALVMEQAHTVSHQAVDALSHPSSGFCALGFVLGFGMWRRALRSRTSLRTLISDRKAYVPVSFDRGERTTGRALLFEICQLRA